MPSTPAHPLREDASSNGGTISRSVEIGRFLASYGSAHEIEERTFEQQVTGYRRLTKRMLDDACDTKRVMGTRYRGLQRDTPVHVKTVTRTDAALRNWLVVAAIWDGQRPYHAGEHSRAVLVAAAKRRTRRVAGSIERRRRHERGVVVPTSE